MGTRGKTLTILGLVVVVGAALSSMGGENSQLFKGQLEQIESTESAAQDSASGENTLEIPYPDLTAELSIIAPETDGGNLVLDVTIKNQGEAAVDGSTPYSYELFLNGASVFANTDSFTVMEPGDSFNFQYPVSKEIYQFPDSGSAMVVVDANEAVTESNEDNNQVEQDYFL